MNLVIYAVPFFLLAIVAELLYGIKVRRNTYRLNDSFGSLSLGVLSQARRFVTLGVGGYVYYLITEHFSLPLMDANHWWTWLLAMLAYDFCYYWLHRLGHERTILWAAHVAHHQSEDYNLTTALRQTSSGFLLSWVFYLPMFLMGVPAEVVVTVGSINLIYQFWVHTEHVPKLGWYEWVFVTPSNHRVHHAQNDIYLDRNYGGLFILWDRLFGTFQEELPEQPCIFGITGPLRSFSPIKALTHVYVDMARDSWRTAHWRDKLRVWVARTGWRPADVAARWPVAKPDLSQFRKFNPVVPTAVSWYGFVQLILMAALLQLMQLLYLPYWAGVALWLVMIVTLTVTAFWLNDIAPARMLRWDGLRLAALAASLLCCWWLGVDHWLLLAGAVYTALNALCLLALTRGGRAEVSAHSVASH
jgi:sterol desaturase/sphingolipid hydroxylase (fatty acid hydroxylase superfamily)